MAQPLWKTVWKFLKTSKIELPYGPAIPLLGTRLKEMRLLLPGQQTPLGSLSSLSPPPGLTEIQSTCTFCKFKL